MLNGATENGERLFIIKCVLYCKFTEGFGNPTIRKVIQEAGMSHFSPKDCGLFFLEASKDPMIQISSKFEPFTEGDKSEEGDKFNLDLDVLIAINPFYEKQFLDFIDKRMEKVIELLRMSPIELRQMEDIQKETNKVEKIRRLIMFLRKNPRPYFTY